jgi:hypothetical protein
VKERDAQITTLKNFCFAVEAEKDKFREQCVSVNDVKQEELKVLNSKLSLVQFIFLSLVCFIIFAHSFAGSREP